jgi:transcriptional regulator with XRE-family HTH domain
VKDDRTFGQRLRETRVSAGMSQSALEEISGIPKARLSRYENGHVSPSIHTLERLSRALSVSEASLLGDQRAMLESFFNVLYERGVRITSTEQAAIIGNAVADIARALGLLSEESEPPEEGSTAEPALSMAAIAEWLVPGS